MNQIDRTVGFQQVAPCPGAGMGLARDEQHPQPVAYAVDLNQHGVVGAGQLAFGDGRRELQHVAPAMGQRERQLDVTAHRHREALRLVAIDRDVERRRLEAFGRCSLVVDADRHGDGLAENPEGGCVVDAQPAIPVRGAPGMQKMHRRGQGRRAVDVVHAPIGEHDHSGDAPARLLGQRLGQRRHQLRAAVFLPVGNADAPHLRVAARGEPCRQRVGGGCGHCGALAQALAGASILHQEHDVGERFTLFLLIDRAGERADHRCHRQRPQRPARESAPECQRHPRQRHGSKRGDQ